MDFINSVCPCAGLSMLNRQREGNVSFLSSCCKILSNQLQFRLIFFFKSLSLSQSGRGADAAQNEWMLKSAEYVLSVVKPKVSVRSRKQHNFTLKSNFAFCPHTYHPQGVLGRKRASPLPRSGGVGGQTGGDRQGLRLLLLHGEDGQPAARVASEEGEDLLLLLALKRCPCCPCTTQHLQD